MWIFIVITWLCVYTAQTAEVTISTNVGSIKGKTREVVYDETTHEIVEFLGIPFAEPPIGNLRFELPIAKSNFSEVFDATKYGLPCKQYIETPLVPRSEPLVTSEDCLTLNIHTPNTGNTSSYPVMVFIHGGGYTTGESNSYSGHILASYGEVIIVTINYRLGPFGFLSTEDDQFPGNAGLWDQHLAIKWVANNINRFGGNASRITIFGESAGAGSVSLQTIFEGNRGLFNKAIIESGSANAFWNLGLPGSFLDSAKKLAMKLECSLPDDTHGSDIVKCLRNVKNSTEIAIQAALLPWTPRRDHNMITSQALNSIKWPTNASDEGLFRDIDVMLGTNGYEGHFFMSTLLKGVVENMKAAPKQTRNTILKGTIKYWIQLILQNPETLDRIVDAVMFLYTNAEDPNDIEFFLKQFSDFITDTFFFIPALKDVLIHSYMNTRTNTYQYEFNHRYPYMPPGNDWLKGSTHAGELGYVFGFPPSMRDFMLFTDEQALTEWSTSKLVMDYWTNFAKTGNPNEPKSVPAIWKKYSHDKQEYLYFPMTGNPKAKQFLNPRRAAFWMDYVPKLMKPKMRVAPKPKNCEPTSAGSENKSYWRLYLVTLIVLSCNIWR